MRRILQVLGALAVLATPLAGAAAPRSRPDPTPGASPRGADDPGGDSTGRAGDDGDDGDAHGADGFVLYEFNHHVRPKEINFSLGGGFNNVGLAAWFTIPVVPDGLVRDVNDQLNVEVGLVAGLYRDALYGLPGDTFPTLAVSGGLRWDFHVTQAWVPFVLLKIAINFGFDKIVLPGGGAGVLYRITDDWRLRLELGYPLGIAVGLTFDLPAL